MVRHSLQEKAAPGRLFLWVEDLFKEGFGVDFSVAAKTAGAGKDFLRQFFPQEDFGDLPGLSSNAQLTLLGGSGITGFDGSGIFGRSRSAAAGSGDRDIGGERPHQSSGDCAAERFVPDEGFLR